MNDDSWYGKNGAQLKCPFPGCNHVGAIITKVHCRKEHNMEREEVGKLYGVPKSMKANPGWDVMRG